MTIKDFRQKYTVHKKGIAFKWEVKDEIVYWIEDGKCQIFQRQMDTFLQDLEAVLSTVDEDAQHKVDEIRKVLNWK